MFLASEARDGVRDLQKYLGLGAVWSLEHSGGSTRSAWGRLWTIGEVKLCIGRCVPLQILSSGVGLPILGGVQMSAAPETNGSLITPGVPGL